jgi:hypothetical protein
VTGATSVLVVGRPNKLWKYDNSGLKIDAAARSRNAGRDVFIITEDEFDRLCGGIALSTAESAAARSRFPSEVGVPYRPAPRGRRRQGTLMVDMDAIDRATREHHATTNLLAQAIRDAGLEPLSPYSQSPAFDIAWKHKGVSWVVEVKSVTAESERQQTRLGIGQVLEYAFRLRRDGHRVRPVLALSRTPTRQDTAELCKELGITLCSPTTFISALALHR